MSKRQIRVQGHASVKAPADQVEITFRIVSRDRYYANAAYDLTERTKSLKIELISARFDPNSLKTSSISIEPWHELIDGRMVDKGYQASHELLLELPYDHNRLCDLLDIFSTTESRGEFSVRFTVKDMEPIRQSVLEQAVQTAKARAAAMAAAAGATLGPLVSIEYGWDELRIHSETQFKICDSVTDYTMDVRPKDVIFQDTVTVTWEIR